MFGIEASLLKDEKLLRLHLSEGVKASGATLCDMVSKRFPNGGVTVLALLAESHASLHTYPEDGSLFLDAFTCGELCCPKQVWNVMKTALKPRKETLSVIRRGLLERNQLRSFLPTSSLPKIDY